ncbi:isopentenyl phosphate kinase [Candidatus Bathyarchaeota archaeon]|nr:isopentenyl phosphate kinase [Candidatus Bathyarchaeota archaeon]
MSEKNVVMIKLGGSVITDKSREFTSRNEVIDRLAREIHCFVGRSRTKLIVAHGGGSFPHVYAKQYKIHLGGYSNETAEGVSRVQNSAARLNRLVVERMMEIGENPISIQPSACVLARNSRIIRWNTTILEKALDSGLVPVPYGDVAFDEAKGCCILSTEEILRYLATRLTVSKIVIGIKEKGVLDRNGKLIPVVSKSNLKGVLEWVKGSSGIDVTGGMRSKILTLYEIAKANDEIECVIVDVSKPDALKNCLEGKHVTGTIIRR